MGHDKSAVVRATEKLRQWPLENEVFRSQVSVRSVTEQRVLTVWKEASSAIRETQHLVGTPARS